MSRRLDVLHVHSGNLYGGIESILVTLAKQPENLLEHTFALCFQGRLEQELRALNTEVLLTAPARLSLPWTVHRARSALREKLQMSHFDVAICHSSWSRAIFGPVLRAANQRFVIWQHSAGENQHWLDRWAQRVKPALAVCNSNYTAILQSRREPATKTAVVYPPVQPPKNITDRTATRLEVREELGVPADTIIILQAGRIEAGKGHQGHLEAVAALLDIQGWLMVQVGGAQRAEEHAYQLELNRSVQDLGLSERVRFLGERADMDRLYAAADIYCQPGTLPESFGITFVEALFAGLPVVTTDIGAAPEIVNPECGILVPRNDVTAVASALRLLLTDHAARDKLGQAGPERAAYLSAPVKSVARLQEILSEISG